LVTVTVAVPEAPGTRVGVLTTATRSAAPALVFTEIGDAVLFAGVGSALAVVTPALPPERVLLGLADARTFTGMLTASEEPGVIGPATVQLIGPLGIGPVQPAGNEVI
jgi:hypothetical protein